VSKQPRKKIDPAKLRKWTDEGHTQSWIAKQFGCSFQAVSKHVRRYKLAKAKFQVEHGLRPEMDQKMDSVAQLISINKHTVHLLEQLMAWIDGDEEAVQALESCRKKVNIGIRKAPVYIDEVTMKDPRETALKAIAEIRMQTNTALEIQKTLWQYTEVKEILQLIIDHVNEFLTPDQRQALADRIKVKRALRLEVK